MQVPAVTASANSGAKGDTAKSDANSTVTNFLLHDTQVPQAVAHTLSEIQGCLERLPQNDTFLRTVARLQWLIKATSIFEASLDSLHGFIDATQLELGNIDDQIIRTWFRPEVADSA